MGLLVSGRIFILIFTHIEIRASPVKHCMVVEKTSRMKENLALFAPLSEFCVGVFSFKGSEHTHCIVCEKTAGMKKNIA